MVSRAERAASAASRTAGRGVGAGIGAAFSSPAGFVTIAIIALVGIAIFFRKDIGAFFEKTFEGFGKIELPDFNFPEFPKFPDFNFPDFNFPDFPEFPAFPELPDFAGLFSGFQEQQESFLSNLQLQFTNLFGGGTPLPQPQQMVENTGLLSQEEVLACQCGSTVIQDAFGNIFNECKVCAAVDTALPSQDPALNVPVLPAGSGGVFGGVLDFLGLTPATPTPQPLDNQGIGFDVPINDPTGLAGGGSFIGGTTTFGDQTNIVDTLSEVLAIFPQLTASQASNALFSNPNLNANDFAQITPIQPSISSAGGDPEQIINNASGGFSGLTPEQIANILTGGNISNF